MLKTSIFLIALSTVTAHAFGQAIQSVQTPNVAAINKFIESPVNTGTGIPEIAIPIYTIEQSDYSVPISLNYHAGGIKVDETSSDVGLGWSLMAGGSISRTIRDFKDEIGYYQNYGSLEEHWHFCFSNEDPYSYPYSLHEWEGFTFDKESDMYYFNVGAYSGRFIFNHSRQTMLIPEQDIKIEVNGSFGSWKITTPDGVQFFLGSAEYAASVGLSTSQDEFTSSWLLDKIITPQNHVIDFEYSPTFYQEESLEPHSQRMQNINFIPGFFGRRQRTSYTGKKLSAIKSNICEIDFTYNNAYREDIKAGGNARSLVGIEIKDRINNVIIKNFQLQQSYFTTNLSQPPYSVYGWNVEPYLGKRLRLDAISECDANNNCLPSTQFSYNKYNPVPNLPYRVSTGRDHWGYYNGQDGNTTLISNPVENTWSELAPYQQYLANREQNETYKKAYMLDEIKFTAGGITQYNYETIPGGGGLRIKQIKTIPGNNQSWITKQYSYINPILTGGTPIYIQVITPPPATQCQGVSCSRGGSESEHLPLCCDFDRVLYDNPVNMFGDISSNYVIHETVIEQQAGNGSIEYGFDVEDIANEQNLGEVGISPYIMVFPILRSGKMLSKKIKDRDGKTLKEITYTYGSYNRFFPAKQAWRTFMRKCDPVIQEYQQLSGGVFLAETKEIEYDNNPTVDPNNPPFKLTTTVNEYAGIPAFNTINAPAFHHMLTKQTRDLSNGDKVITRFKYPIDYISEIGSFALSDSWDMNSKAIEKLIERNFISEPIEKLTTVLKGANEYILRGEISINKFNATPLNEVVLKDKTQTYQPLSGSAFSMSSFSSITKTGSTYSFNKNAGYETKAEYSNYDGNNNISEGKTSDGIINSFIWGYNNTRLIAVAKNAPLKNIFFTSFEDDNGNDITSGGFTGLKSKLSGFQKNLTGLDNGTYNLSYWVKVNSIWQFFTTTVDVSGNSYMIILSGQVDEIRFYPIAAQLETYTYDPLTGIKSKTTINNKTSSYEYDNYQRLLRIRDEDHNIIKQYDYVYRQLINPLASWSPTGLTRCKKCDENPLFFWAIKQKQLTDNNAASPTYNKTTWVDDGEDQNCVPESDWQNTTSSPTCVVDQFGINIGVQSQEQININPCSDDYYKKRLTYVAPVGNPCPIPSIYAKINIDHVEYYDWCTVGEISVDYFSNASCTHPYYYATPDVNFQIQNSCTGNTNMTTLNGTYGGTMLLPSTQYLYYNSNGMTNNGTDCFVNYILLPGTGYIPVN